MRQLIRTFPATFLILVLGAVLWGCGPGVWQDAQDEAVPPPPGRESDGPLITNPEDGLNRAQVGDHVQVLFLDGSGVTGYLVEKMGNEFTIRGMGWQATRVETYWLNDVAEFLVSDPQPDTEGMRF